MSSGKRIIGFDDYGNWVDVSGGLTLMTIAEAYYQELIEELNWRHASAGPNPISTAECYAQDGVVEEITVLDYVSQRDIVLKRDDLPY